MDQDAHLRYPIGPFRAPDTISTELIEQWIADIAAFPAQLQSTVEQLTDTHLAQSYRPGGWTGRQVIHHIADSHINAYVRFKWTLTEDTPTVKAYREAKWAALPDTFQVPVHTSVQLLTALHSRWSALLHDMTPGQFERAYLHSDSGRTSLAKATGLYSWHGRHHLSHLHLILTEQT